MNLFDLHVCVEGTRHPDHCRNHYWLKANEVRNLVNLSEADFEKAHDPVKGGSCKEADASYKWEARGDEEKSPMEKLAGAPFGSYEVVADSRSAYSCYSCGVEGLTRSAALGHCENCNAPIRKHNGFKDGVEKKA